MSEKEKISANPDEAWDTGELGRDAKHAKVLEENIEAEIDEGLELVPISIRLQKSLIEDLKTIGELHGIGYQPLIRQILCRFAENEKKHLLNEKLAEFRAAQKERQRQEELDPSPERRRA